MTDDRDAQRAARRAETEAMVEAEAAKAKEVLTKRAEQKAQALAKAEIMRLIVAQVGGLVDKTADVLAQSRGRRHH
jgi:limonene-1,2-epoxide hydrolase